MAPSPPLPAGSEQLERFARSRHMAYEATPNPSWFAAWEPYDTMVSAEGYVNSVSWSMPPGTATIAEPWLAPLDSEPLDRTLLAFVSHPGFVRRAAARVGDHFNTRVAYIENPPPPTVKLGDATWDGQVITMAASPTEAAAAFPPAVRQLLLSWRFTGHLEVRPGGLVVHFAGTRPSPEHLDRLLKSIPPLVRSFLA